MAEKNVFPETIGNLFFIGGYDAEGRIRRCKEQPEEYGNAALIPWDHHNTLWDCGRDRGDGTQSGIFLLCGIDEVAGDTPIESLKIPGAWEQEGDKFVIRVRPNRNDDIYIADNSAFDKKYNQVWKVAHKEGRKCLTREEVVECSIARARTIMPVNEYRGGYKEPVIVIERALSFDEVEVVSGPHKNKKTPRV